jgi:prepilin-type N-terminal cleavage/methylation domain-containing protein
MSKNNSNDNGFTLAEFMIVIAIIGILFAIAIPQFTSYRVRSYNSIPLSSPKIVDEKEQELAIGSLAIGYPENMSLDETKNVFLMIDIQKEINDLFVSLPEEYAKQGAKVKMSNRMQATLTSHDFIVTNVTPVIQAVSSNNTTKWDWELKPKEAGDHEVTVTLSALIPVQGEQTPLVVNSYKRSITVTVKNQTKIWSFLKEESGWLLGIITAFISVLFFLIKFIKRKNI